MDGPYCVECESENARFVFVRVKNTNILLGSVGCDDCGALVLAGFTTEEQVEMMKEIVRGELARTRKKRERHILRAEQLAERIAHQESCS